MTDWMIETMIATTVLMVAVLLVRRIVATMFGARVAYMLWLAPALRMILPALPAAWFGAAAQPFQPVVALPTPDVVALDAAGTALWPAVALAVWLGGALLFFGWHLRAYWQFRRQVLANAREIDASDGIMVSTSPGVTSPIAMGVFARAIVVPADFEHRYDSAEQRLALAHEHVHHKRGDLRINTAALAMLALHWFNPVAHIAHRAFRLDQEAACDAAVLASASEGERFAYGNALFKSATGPVPLAACAMGSAATLKRRLRQIVDAASRPERLRTGMITAAAIVGIGLLVTASTRDAVQAEPATIAAKTQPDAPAMIALGGVIIDRPDNADRAWAVASAESTASKAATGWKSPGGQMHSHEASDAALEREAADAEREAHAASIEAAAEAREAEIEARAAAREADQAVREAAREASREARASSGRAARCDDGRRKTDVSVERRDGKTMRVVVCGKTVYDERQVHEEVVRSLREARNDLAAETGLADRIRAQILKSLDRQIAYWTRHSAPPVAPAPPVPPTPSVAPAAPASPPSPLI